VYCLKGACAASSDIVLKPLISLRAIVRDNARVLSKGSVAFNTATSSLLASNMGPPTLGIILTKAAAVIAAFLTGIHCVSVERETSVF